MNAISAPQALGLGLALLTSATLTPAASAQTYRQDHQLSSVLGGGLALHPDGSAALVGFSNSSGTVARLDAGGSLTLTRKLETVSGMSLRTSAGTFTKTGMLVLVGSAASKAWISGVDPNSLTAQWDHTLGKWFGSLFCVEAMPDGGVVAGGYNEDDSFADEGLVVRIGPTGNLVWQRKLKTAAVAPSLEDVTATSDGGVLVTQKALVSSAGLGGYSLVLTKLDANGSLVWQKHYGGDGALYQGRAVELAGGGFLVAGVTEVGDDTDDYRFWSARVSATGALLGSKRYASYASDVFNGSLHGVVDLVATSDGGCAVLVQQPMPPAVPGGAADDDAALLKLAADGDVQWFRSVGEHGLDETPLGLARVPGGFLVADRLESGAVRVSRLDGQGRVGGSCSVQQDLAYFQEDLATVAFPLNAPPSPTSSNATEQHAKVLLQFGSSSLLCGNFCHLDGGGFGVGLAGTGGLVPQLTASSGYCIGGTANLELTGAVGGTVGILGIATQTQAWPLLGGWSYLAPASTFQTVIFAGGTPGAPGVGATTLPINGDLSGLLGTTIYTQALLFDSAAPMGWSMSACATLQVQ